MVLTDSPWAVWAWRLASSTTFWLAHDLGRCTRVASPSTHTASPERAISPSHRRSSSRVVMKVPSGWQYPMAASSPSTSAGSDERGQYDNGDRTSLAGVRDLAYGLVPVNVRTCGASRTPS